MKKYYSCLDLAFVKYVGQPIQHMVVSSIAEKLEGKVVFYTTEDFKTVATQGVIKSKIDEGKDEINGIIFFTFKQFCYGGQINMKFIYYILDKGLEIHFARENVSILDRESFNEQFSILFATEYVNQRDVSLDCWDNVYDWIQSSEKAKTEIKQPAGAV